MFVKSEKKVFVVICSPSYHTSETFQRLYKAQVLVTEQLGLKFTFVITIE